MNTNVYKSVNSGKRPRENDTDNGPQIKKLKADFSPHLKQLSLISLMSRAIA